MNTNNSLAVQNAAVEKLNKSLAKTSLDDLVKSKTRRSLLLVDCSGSMSYPIKSGERRIDALRKVVATLRETHPVPVAAFGVKAHGQVEVVDTIPEPHGGTPMAEAILFALNQGANHIVLVTDGEANNEIATFDAARRFGGQIDTFYIGNGNDRGSAFAAELAAMTGGTANLTDLGKPKELAGKIVLMLGDGSDVI
jgi:Mg-chelatase subunit ChlD